MTKQPITANIISNEELAKLSKTAKVGQYFIPTVSNLSNTAEEAHYRFFTTNNALYVNMAGNNYRVIDFQLSQPRIIETADGKVPARNVKIRYLKTYSDEVASGECIACKSSAAENMVMDIARRRLATNISLESVGQLQKPLTNLQSDAKSARKARKIPLKKEIENKKPDEKRSLWHGLFKDIAPNVLQAGCVITLIFCVMGMLVSPFMPFIVFGCLAGMLFPGKIVELLEKAVQFVKKAVKVVLNNAKFVVDCMVYDHRSKDFWGAQTADPRKIRRSRKADRKAFIKEVKERQAFEREVDRKVAESTKKARLEAFKTVFLPRYSKKKSLSQNNMGRYTDYSNTLGM